MTDLEMTKLCAEAMDIVLDARNPYNPLHDDAQAMALVKKFGLDIARMCGDWTVVKVQGNYDGVESGGNSKDLNRAIVECVAKMQEAK